MKGIRVIIFVLLFCVFPARIVVHWMPLIGVPMVSTVISLIEYSCIAFLLSKLLLDTNRNRRGYLYYFLYLLYWIYSAYLVYYIIINPLIPRNLMAHVSESNFDIILSIMEVGLLIPVVVNYQHYLNFDLFAKSSTLFVFFVLLIYSIKNDMSLYIYERTLPIYEQTRFNIGEYGMISSQMMGEFCSIAFLFNLTVRTKWTHNSIRNNTIFVVVSFFICLLLFLFSQRGPVLFLIVTLLLYFYAKGSIGKVLIITFLMVLLILYLFGDALSSIISKYELSLIERFLNIGEDGGSGRFGDEESEYNLALKQILQEPIFGTYFRTIIGSRIGNYPHNFILELLMTFGLAFTIPFLLICWKGIRISYYIIRNNLPMTAFCLIFLNVYACHLTSYTIANSNNMWLLLAMVVGYQNRINKRHEVKPV